MLKDSDTRIEISPKILKEIEAEIERTAIYPSSFLKSNDYCGDLSVSKVENWRCGETKTARECDVKEFFRAWRQLHDAPERIELTEDRIKKLYDERDRTGVSVIRLLKMSDTADSDVNVAMINNWLAGASATARRDHFYKVLSLWRALPTNPYVEITREMLNKLRAEIERTGIGPSALFRGLRPSQANGIRSGLVISWLSEKTKTVQKSHFDLVLQRWRKLPDREDEWFTVEDIHIKHIRDELTRTGVSQASLLRSKEAMPDAPTLPILHRFLRGNLKLMRHDHYSFLVHLLEKLPDREAQEPGSDKKKNRVRLILLSSQMRCVRRCRTNGKEQAFL